MHDPDFELDKLDSFIHDHPLLEIPDGFSRQVMQNIRSQSPWLVLWENPWIQWSAASIGLVFATGRLLNYIFSTWLAIELAG